MKKEFERRQSKTEAVIALFRSRPLSWISVIELAHVGGFAAWRTRVSEARTILEGEGATLEWNRDVKDSQYRLLPYVPVARSAEVEVSGQRELFPPQNFAK